MSHIRAVIFDFGGVLFDWSPEYLYREIFPDEVERRWFLSEVCAPDWNLAQDAGRSIADAVAIKIAEYPDHEIAIRAYYGRWHEMLKGTIEAGVALVEALAAAEVPLYGLTNWSAETFPYVEHRYDFLRHFRDVVVSGRVKLVKPDAEIYRLALSRIGEAPQHCAFIDDSLRNIDAARSLGLHGIHHRDAEETADALRSLGLRF